MVVNINYLAFILGSSQYRCFLTYMIIDYIVSVVGVLCLASLTHSVYIVLRDPSG